MGQRTADIAATRFTTEPVLLIEGPRSVSKSTLLRHLATQAGVEVSTSTTSTPVRRSSDIRGSSWPATPVCPQRLPEGPADPRFHQGRAQPLRTPGPLLLAGSTRFDAPPTAAQPLTGRLHRLTLRPVCQDELDRYEELLPPLAFEVPLALVELDPSQVKRSEVIRRVTTGGFPLAVYRPTTADRNRWFDDYVRLTLEPDVRDLSRVRQAASLPQLLERLAGQMS